MTYGSIVADPPWPIDWHPPVVTRAGGSFPGSRREKGERIHKPRDLGYPTLTLEEIKRLDVGRFAADESVLFLWSTRALFREGVAAAVARAWGFEPFGEIIWGLRNPGLGARAMANDHEPVLLARRGRATLTSAEPLGVHFWRQPYGHDGRAPYKLHSAKPEAFLDLVETIAPGRYLELFARRNRLGWDTWGNEAFEHVEIA